jgi:Single-strand binding protein family
MNAVHLTSRPTRDPELRSRSNGQSVCAMRLAVDGPREGATTFIDVTAFDRLADNCGEYLSQGRRRRVGPTGLLGVGGRRRLEALEARDRRQPGRLPPGRPAGGRAHGNGQLSGRAGCAAPPQASALAGAADERRARTNRPRPPRSDALQRPHPRPGRRARRRPAPALLSEPAAAAAASARPGRDRARAAAAGARRRRAVADGGRRRPTQRAAGSRRRRRRAAVTATAPATGAAELVLPRAARPRRRRSGSPAATTSMSAARRAGAAPRSRRCGCCGAACDSADETAPDPRAIRTAARARRSLGAHVLRACRSVRLHGGSDKRHDDVAERLDAAFVVELGRQRGSDRVAGVLIHPLGKPVQSLLIQDLTGPMRA